MNSFTWLTNESRLKIGSIQTLCYRSSDNLFVCLRVLHFVDIKKIPVFLWMCEAVINFKTNTIRRRRVRVPDFREKNEPNHGEYERLKFVPLVKQMITP